MGFWGVRGALELVQEKLRKSGFRSNLSVADHELVAFGHLRLQLPQSLDFLVFRVLGGKPERVPGLGLWPGAVCLRAYKGIIWPCPP